ncbi:MAG: DUF1080 domain-containing protein [Verrucomicrobiaceae bacterium]|nr:MAG: DUF1080 domain-containing protein [Verrucomicrobiaceae bacterium]
MKYLITPLVLLSSCGLAMAADGFTDLFNGKNLDGWTRRGGTAEYSIEDGGVIVGTSVAKTPNTFLCTAKDYDDFVLEYEFKVDPKLNSGVQIRSKFSPDGTELLWKGKVVKVSPNRVYGYQVEIDPNPEQDRWWSAGLYDEGRRAWLYPGVLGGNGKAFGEQGKKIFKQGDWNKVRVEAVGDTIKTTLNGTPCASIKDSANASGFIALQVHDIGKDNSKEGTKVRWRNLKIKELPLPEQNVISAAEKTAGWRLLWDGKTSEGWRGIKSQDFPKGGWVIKDGLLTIMESGGGESSAAGDIITKDKFSNFELSVDFRLTPGANSGIKTFVDPGLNKGDGSAIGPEFQVLDDVRHPDAKLGRDGNRTIGSLYDMITAPVDKKVNPVGEWNNARIVSNNKQLTYFLNGVKTVDIRRGSKEWKDLVEKSKYKKWPAFGELPEGHILLQDHGNRVSFRNVKIRNLPAH